MRGEKIPWLLFISPVFPARDQESKDVYDVTDGLSENNDKYAIERSLPEIQVGNILVIHDTGAHGPTMGYNYNGKLRSAKAL